MRATHFTSPCINGRFFALIVHVMIICVAPSATAQPSKNPAAPSRIDAASKAGVYVCPPCSVDCHDKTYSQPGVCPHPDCQMKLIDRSAVRFVAIVIWNGAEILDFAGPAEVFAATRLENNQPAFEVYTVGPTLDPIVSQGFIKVTPQCSIENAPRPDIFVLPGGGTIKIQSNRRMIQWVKRTAADAEIAMSVCTGAHVLAAADLLDYKEATTYHRSIAGLRAMAPFTVVHDDQRWVDNGDVVTTAGVSAGIDGALHVVSRLYGKKTARQTAAYMEYDWRPDRVTGLVSQPDAMRRYTPSQKFIQLLLEDGMDAALVRRQALLDSPNKSDVPSERQINQLGYRYLFGGSSGKAIEILTFNAMAHPTAFNVFDSLGEAFMLAGKRDLAVKNYRKSLELNPDNSGAVKMLKKLTAQ